MKSQILCLIVLSFAQSAFGEVKELTEVSKVAVHPSVLYEVGGSSDFDRLKNINIHNHGWWLTALWPDKEGLDLIGEYDFGFGRRSDFAGIFRHQFPIQESISMKIMPGTNGEWR